MVLEENELAGWIGNTRCLTSHMSPWPAQAAAATLDAEGLVLEPGSALPPLWQWFYFLATAPQERLGVDGHPERGGFMPPVALPRRMFAGARMRFHRPLSLGREATRTDTIEKVELKTGRSGQLAFVTVRSEFHQDDALCIEEAQDIVYREPGGPIAAPAVREPEAAPEGTWSRRVEADSRLLFRFSALTFNAHRIHYDRRYAHQEEGYPGLVVHGPLTAVLLADLVRRHTARPLTGFRFRGKAPLFDLAPFELRGRLAGDEVALEARGPDGKVALAATAALG
jgi:3-methylfumaryl-CoA hydratase